MDELDNFGKEYGRLVLKELERLNDNFESLRKDMDEKFKEMNDRMSTITNIERTVAELKTWKEKVDDVWSTSQMKETKDEVYKQKNRWTAALAIMAVIQVLVTIIIALKDKIF